MSNHEEAFPNIQPEPPLTQLQAIRSDPVTGYHKEEISACLCFSPHEKLGNCKVSPPSPPGKTDQKTSAALHMASPPGP